MPVESKDIAPVDQALRRHPRASNLRFSTGEDRIEVFERVASGLNDYLATFGISDPDAPPATGQVGFAPVLRFVLVDMEKRFFQAERVGPGGVWETLSAPAPMYYLAKRVIGQL